MTDLRTSISDMEELIEGLRPAIVRVTPPGLYASVLTVILSQVSHKTTAVPTKWADEEIKIALEG